MNSIDYGFCDYLDSLWNLYQVRAGLSSANAARRVLDLREDAYASFLGGVSAQEFFLEDDEV